MKLAACLFAVALSFAQLPPKEGKVVSLTEPNVNFGKFTTYSWERGQETFDKKAHQLVVDAIDAEMKARGLKQVPAKADVTIRYFSIVRTDVDLDKLEETQKQGKPAPTKNLGRLAIVMRDPSNKRVWAADTVQSLGTERSTAYDEIAAIVDKLFATYPVKEK